MNKILVLIWLLTFPIMESISNYIDHKYKGTFGDVEKTKSGNETIFILLFYFIVAFYLGR